MESDIRYYRRRAFEEMAAASRAVTPQARERRLALVETYVEHLKALKAPIPFSDHDLTQAHRASGAYCLREMA